MPVNHQCLLGDNSLLGCICHPRNPVPVEYLSRQIYGRVIVTKACWVTTPFFGVDPLGANSLFGVSVIRTIQCQSSNCPEIYGHVIVTKARSVTLRLRLCSAAPGFMHHGIRKSALRVSARRRAHGVPWRLCSLTGKNANSVYLSTFFVTWLIVGITSRRSNRQLVTYLVLGRVFDLARDRSTKYSPGGRCSKGYKPWNAPRFFAVSFSDHGIPALFGAVCDEGVWGSPYIELWIWLFKYS